MLRAAIGLTCWFFLASCATTLAVAPEVRSQLAPMGKLRAGINYANAIVATRDPVTGELRGVSVDLVREVARRINVPLELVGFDFSGKLPGSRVLEGRFLVVEQTLAIPKGREAGIRYLREFIEEAKASGFIAQSLAKSGNANVPVSPPAAVK